MKRHRLITDGNAVYEVDLDCLYQRFGQSGGWRQADEDRYFGAYLDEGYQEIPDEFYGISARERLEQTKRYEHNILKLRGKGIGIAVLDTGADPHPDFRSRIIGFYDPLNGRQAVYDDHGHGTHVAVFLHNHRQEHRNIKNIANRIEGNAMGYVFYVKKRRITHESNYIIRSGFPTTGDSALCGGQKIRKMDTFCTKNSFQRAADGRFLSVCSI